MTKNKKRTVNFSEKEIEILRSLVVKHKDKIGCQKSDNNTNLIKKNYGWLEIEIEFNSICGKTFIEGKILKNKYEKLKKRSKQKFSKKFFF